jgi:RNA polymerase sigma factor (sigma-70 family)
MMYVLLNMKALYLETMSQKETAPMIDVVKKYGNKLLYFIKGKVNIVEDAEDILQEVWYQTSKISDLADFENLSAWLYKVARNKITDNYRKKKDDLLEDFSFEDEDGEISITEILLADDSDLEAPYFKDLFWEELMNSLKELPENQRLVFVQNEMEDKTLQLIADEQGENIKTIISRKNYAVKHLRKKLQKVYLEFTS